MILLPFFRMIPFLFQLGKELFGQDLYSSMESIQQ